MEVIKLEKCWNVSEASENGQNLKQNNWNKVKKSGNIGEDQKTLISTFVSFLTTLDKVLLETGH